MPRLRRAAAVLILSVIASSCQGGDDTDQQSDALVTSVAIGTLPGELSVTGTGAASYTIPIDVPAGFRGLTPELALGYDSRGGNGMVGVGWALQGLSRITRCPRSQAYGGMTDRVNFDASDHFCLDGTPLVVVNGGTYGAAGSEYRTAPDRNARIILDSVLADGQPSGFTVYHKDGRIGRYHDPLAAARVSSTALDGTLVTAPTQAIS